MWSKASYRLREITENPGNRVMYYLADGPERAFVSEELMLIPEDTELPPDYVQTWYYLSRWIDISYDLFSSFHTFILTSFHCPSSTVTLFSGGGGWNPPPPPPPGRRKPKKAQLK